MVAQLDFIEQFNAVEVPGPLVTIDAISEEAIKVKDEYFRRVLASLQLSELALSTTCRFDVQELVSVGDDPRHSDNFFEELWLGDEQLIASVSRVRNTFNYQVSQFAKYQLSDRAITMVRELQSFENMIAGIPNTTD